MGGLQISQQGLDEGLKSHVLGGGQVSGCGHRVDLPLILYPTPQPGKFKILNQNLKDALAEVERLRSERSPPPPPRGTPLSPNSRPPGHGAKNLDAQATKFKSQPRPICHTATGGGGRCSLFSAAICREGVQVLWGEALSGPSGPGSCLSGPDLYSRRQSETCSKNNASSCSSFLFVVIAVLVLNALLT